MTLSPLKDSEIHKVWDMISWDTYSMLTRVHFEQVLNTFTTDEEFMDTIAVVMGMPENMPRDKSKEVGLDAPGDPP